MTAHHASIRADNRRNKIEGWHYEIMSALQGAPQEYRAMLNLLRDAALEQEHLVSAQVETGWVIELGDSEPAAPKYWCALHLDTLRKIAWTSNHDMAIRFARQEDAERFYKLLMPKLDVRICQHQWV